MVDPIVLDSNPSRQQLVQLQQIGRIFFTSPTLTTCSFAVLLPTEHIVPFIYMASAKSLQTKRAKRTKFTRRNGRKDETDERTKLGVAENMYDLKHLQAKLS